jgi:hypothetical protein
VKNKNEDLRNLLFETLECLLDEDNPMDVERALAIAKVGAVVVNSAKAEVTYLKVTGNTKPSKFFEGTKVLEVGAPKTDSQTH